MRFRNVYGALFIVIILTVVVGVYMHRDYYQMAVLVSADNESGPEWPNKRKWFDAREWLETSQYVKINDFYVLNKNHIPIDILNDFGITRRLQDSIKESINIEPALSSLNDMDAIVFFDLMKDNLSYEYLMTEFNDQKLKPTEDYFLIFFPYANQMYEVELLRTPYNNGFIFMTNGSLVHKAGYWHSTSPAGYSYRDFIAGKPVK